MAHLPLEVKNSKKRFSEVDDTRSTKPTFHAGQHENIFEPVWTRFKVLRGPILGSKGVIFGQFAPRSRKWQEKILKSG